MPTMANITVKKADGTTDITYSAVVSSGGDKSPAIWRSTTVGSAPEHQPELRISSRPNGTNTSRVLEVNYSYPSLVTSTDTGRSSVAFRYNLNGNGVSIPNGMPSADVNEAGAQLANLLASSLVKSILQSGFSAT